VLNGWVEITSGNETLKQTSIKNFNINEGEKHLESLMGKAKFFEVTRQFKLSLDVLTDITVMYKHFIPALIEKAKVISQHYSFNYSFKATNVCEWLGTGFGNYSEGSFKRY